MRNNKSNFLDYYSNLIKKELENNNDNFIKFCEILTKFNYKDDHIFILGNGGSSSIASHCAVDFIKILNFKAHTFSDHNLITCFSNDYGYENWSKKSLEVFVKKKI